MLLQISICLIILLISCLLLTSCQMQTQLTIYMEPVSNEKRVAEINIEGEKYKKVLEEYQKMLLQVPEDSIEAANIFSNMGGIYAEYEEDKQKAEYYLNKAIKIHKDQNDEVGLASDYTEMSKIYIYIGEEIEGGIKYLELAEEIYSRHGLDNSFGLAGVMTNKGHLYLKEGSYEKALEAYKKAEEIDQNRQNEDAYNNLFIGKSYEKMQRYQEAEEQYIEGIRICKNQNNMYLEAELYYQLGKIYDYKNNYNDAIKQYLKALEFFDSDEYYIFKTAANYNNLAVDYYKIKKPEKALDASIKAYKSIILVKPVTKEVEEKINLCMNNLKRCYQSWSLDKSDEGFDKWVAENLIENE